MIGRIRCRQDEGGGVYGRVRKEGRCGAVAGAVLPGALRESRRRAETGASALPPSSSSQPSLISTRLAHVHLSLRPGFYSVWWLCPFPLDPAEGARCLVQLHGSSGSTVLPHIDALVARERAFANLSSGGLCLELRLRADLVPMLDAAVGSPGSWAGSAGLRMPLYEHHRMCAVCALVCFRMMALLTYLLYPRVERRSGSETTSSTLESAVVRRNRVSLCLSDVTRMRCTRLSLRALCSVQGSRTQIHTGAGIRGTA